jgi:hypothetical protein
MLRFGTACPRSLGFRTASPRSLGFRTASPHSLGFSTGLGLCQLYDLSFFFLRPKDELPAILPSLPLATFPSPPLPSLTPAPRFPYPFTASDIKCKHFLSTTDAPRRALVHFRRKTQHSINPGFMRVNFEIYDLKCKSRQFNWFN